MYLYVQWNNTYLLDDFWARDKVKEAGEFAESCGARSLLEPDKIKLTFNKLARTIVWSSDFE